MRIIGGYQNTKKNQEDFALTPYLFSVYVNGRVLMIFGIGICWGYASFYGGIGFGIPKNYPSIINFK